jgi:hypothetical protein
VGSWRHHQRQHHDSTFTSVKWSEDKDLVELL